MKKSLMFVMLGIISFLGINSVSADTFNYDYYFQSHINMTESQISQIIEENKDTLINYWNDNLKEKYPYYYLSLNTSNSSSNELRMYLEYTDNISNFGSRHTGLTTNANTSNIGFLYHSIFCSSGASCYYRDIINHTPNFGDNFYIDIPFTIIQPYNEITDRLYYPFAYYESNFSWQYTSEDNINIVKDSTTLFSLSNGDVIPTYKEILNISNTYTEIDLNKYPYIILSLKDYTPRDTFTSTIYVKGQLCPTTLYNYGMEEKKDYISGYQTQPCSYYYNNFNPFTTYIKSEDIKNHAVYYLTTYNTSKPNSVKVDTSVYDITYITSDKKDDPYVSIGGKNYPTLPYDDLTDSATLTEKNGISNEWTCAKYDTDCLENSSGMNINDLFDKPLEFLKGLWSSITSIFEVITEFLSLLPETMQSFLYLSFMVAIVLGLLKLIL